MKEDPKKQLTGGDTISVERNGGRLTHDFEVADDTYDDFDLLTGYELKDGKVFPLDKSPEQSVLDYKGTDESSFLTDLVEALKTPKSY